MTQQAFLNILDSQPEGTAEVQHIWNYLSQNNYIIIKNEDYENAKRDVFDFEREVGNEF